MYLVNLCIKNKSRIYSNKIIDIQTWKKNIYKLPIEKKGRLSMKTKQAKKAKTVRRISLKYLHVLLESTRVKFQTK